MGALLSALSTIPTLSFIRSLLHKTHTKEQSAFFMQHCAHLKNKKTKRITCLCTVDSKKETKNTVLLLAVENQSNISAVMFQSNLAATLGLGNNGNMCFFRCSFTPGYMQHGTKRTDTHTHRTDVSELRRGCSGHRLTLPLLPQEFFRLTLVLYCVLKMAAAEMEVKKESNTLAFSWWQLLTCRSDL